MSITHTNTHSVRSDSTSSPLQGSAVEVGASEVAINQTYSASSTDVLTAAAFTAADVQSVFLKADADMTLETNSGSSPGNTINLKAGRPLVWEKSAGYFSNPFTTNVTAFYVTTTTANRLQARILTT